MHLCLSILEELIKRILYPVERHQKHAPGWITETPRTVRDMWLFAFLVFQSFFIILCWLESGCFFSCISSRFWFSFSYDVSFFDWFKIFFFWLIEWQTINWMFCSHSLSNYLSIHMCIVKNGVRMWVVRPFYSTLLWKPEMDSIGLDLD